MDSAFASWPVSSIQEMNLNLYYIVNNDNSTVMIRRHFGKYNVYLTIN